eukprot:m.66887 g.66887  ORF g.66887 m.66887 type:complete len:74 (-) comp23740_c0_seq2:1565-1786(-)
MPKHIKNVAKTSKYIGKTNQNESKKIKTYQNVSKSFKNNIDVKDIMKWDLLQVNIDTGRTSNNRTCQIDDDGE